MPSLAFCWSVTFRLLTCLLEFSKTRLASWLAKREAPWQSSQEESHAHRKPEQSLHAGKRPRELNGSKHACSFNRHSPSPSTSAASELDEDLVRPTPTLHVKPRKKSESSKKKQSAQVSPVKTRHQRIHDSSESPASASSGSEPPSVHYGQPKKRRPPGCVDLGPDDEIASIKDRVPSTKGQGTVYLVRLKGKSGVARVTADDLQEYPDLLDEFERKQLGSTSDSGSDSDDVDSEDEPDGEADWDGSGAEEEEEDDDEEGKDDADEEEEEEEGDGEDAAPRRGRSKGKGRAKGKQKARRLPTPEPTRRSARTIGQTHNYQDNLLVSSPHQADSSQSESEEGEEPEATATTTTRSGRAIQRAATEQVSPTTKKPKGSRKKNTKTIDLSFNSMGDEDDKKLPFTQQHRLLCDKCGLGPAAFLWPLVINKKGKRAKDDMTPEEVQELGSWVECQHCAIACVVFVLHLLKLRECHEADCTCETGIILPALPKASSQTLCAPSSLKLKPITKSVVL